MVQPGRRKLVFACMHIILLRTICFIRVQWHSIAAIMASFKISPQISVKWQKDPLIKVAVS